MFVAHVFECLQHCSHLFFIKHRKKIAFASATVNLPETIMFTKNCRRPVSLAKLTCLFYLGLKLESYILKSIKCSGNITLSIVIQKCEKIYQSMQEQNNKHYFLDFYDTM